MLSLLELHVRSSAIYEWMEMPFVSVQLKQICKRSVEKYSTILFLKEWKESKVLPKILNVLSPYFDEWGLDFNDFRTSCMALPDLASTIIFSSFKEPLCCLSGKQMGAYIVLQLLLLADTGATL